MKNDRINNFKKMPTGEKLCVIGTLLITLTVAVILVLQLIGSINVNADIFALLCGIENIMLGYSTRSREGSVYKFNYGVGIFLIVLWILDAVLGGFDLL